MKEKIGKLLELLNEYDEYRGEKRRVYGWTKWKVELDVNLIISKKFGFIKWLVDNDKIDTHKPLYEGIEGRITDYQKILMELSIQDEPIQFLISILK